MMRSALAVLACLVLSFSLSPPVYAQRISAQAGEGSLSFRTLWMRSTSAATTARVPNWTVRQGTLGFVDSTLFRRGVTTMTVYDTTAAYRTESFPFAPNFGPTQANVAATDTSLVPWIVLRVRQDSLTASYGGILAATSGMDSVRVGAEYSYDGINWHSCPGTNTRRFDTVFFTSGQDGLQSPSLVGVEASPGEDAALIQISCHPHVASSNAVIFNRTLCLQGAFVRFIIGGDYSGQFMVEAASWAKVN